MAEEDVPKAKPVANTQKTDPFLFDKFHKDGICAIPPTCKKRKDIMDTFRPTMVDNDTDYGLTQTYAIMDRGPVKIKYIDTKGEYGLERDVPLMPPDKPIVRPGHGRGPLEEFLDEEWAKLEEQRQKILFAKMVKRRRTRLCEERREKLTARKTIKDLIGPKWYQELSPSQIAATDSLSKCIAKDIKANSVCATKEALNKLGLILKSSDNRIRIAISECCKSSVEFLLVLYQVTNFRRTRYTPNDRIILSALVHLTIKDTLRELHVRIPSPPPKARPMKKKPRPPPKEKFASPYLDTTLKKWPKAKEWSIPSTIRPRNEYFGYMEELRKNTIMLCADDESIEMQGEGEEEIVPCPDSAYPDEELDPFTIIELELVQEWVAAQRLYNQFASTKCVPALHKASVYVPCINKYYDTIESSLRLSRTRKSRNSSIKATLSTLPSTGTASGKNGTKKKSIDRTSLKNTVESSPVDLNEGEAFEITCDIARYDGEGCLDCGCEYDQQCVDEWELALALQKPPSTPMCTVVNEIGYEPSEEKIKLLEPHVVDSMQCVCRAELMKKIEGNCCECEKCKEDREKANMEITRIIDGVKQDEDGEQIKIIAGTQSKKKCTCVEKYVKRWDQWEKRREAKKAQDALKSMHENFIVTGVTIDADGKPLYILGGVKPKYECMCYEQKEMEEERNKQIALLAQPLPGGCIQYLISGVRSTPEGNVYDIIGAMPDPSYCCNAIYDAFVEKHSICLKLYEEYMKKVKYDTEEYMKELDPNYLQFQAAPTEEVPPQEDPTGTCICNEPEPESEEEESSLDFSCAEECSCTFIGGNSFYEHVDDSEGEDSLYCRCLEDVHKGVEESFVESLKPSVTMPTTSIDVGQSRYIIMEKFPRNKYVQMEILKRALTKLAEDGFPLAKLPNVHILPQIGLWLQMRTKKVWHEKDIRRYAEKSRQFWRHVDFCYDYDIPKIPEPTFLYEKYDQHNWTYSKLIKKHNQRARRQFDNKIKESSMNYVRNLFPTMFLYEFPNKYFRYNIFAYLPGKPDNVTYFKLWKSHEVKHMIEAKKKQV